jgi:large subunit ribosomal protein L4e
MAKVFDLQGQAVSDLDLPEVFSQPLRADLIHRAVVALQSRKFQPQGRDPMAGKRTTAYFFGVGRDLARVPRVGGERHPRAGNAAFAPMAVGGRRTFPPTTQKIMRKEMNKKEYRLALLSAIAATASKEVVESRGHKVGTVVGLPIIVKDDLQKVASTSEAKKVLASLGIWDDVKRVEKGTKERGGRGSLRGRRIRRPVGPLLVVERDEGIRRAARNIPGVEVVQARNLNVESLAPGTHPGRLTVWTESAIKALETRFKEQ